LNVRITVKLFAIVKDKAGAGEMALELVEGAMVAKAVEMLGEKLPALKDHLARCAFAVNMSYVKPNEMLHDGDELAVIPPVSGG
jgi:sulfur-carrier protein